MSVSARGAALAELALAAAIIAAGVAGYVYFSTTPWLIALAIAATLIGRRKFSDIGVHASGPVLSWMLIGAAGGVALQAFSLYALEPALAAFVGGLPDVSLFRPLIGDGRAALGLLLTVWTLAAFGEEFVFRGFLMRRIADVCGGGRQGDVIALIVSSLLFALSHAYQGLPGMITTGVSGFAFGLAFLACGRSLIAPILMHGVLDTVGVAMIYWGVYPGIHG